MLRTLKNECNVETTSSNNVNQESNLASSSNIEFLMNDGFASLKIEPNPKRTSVDNHQTVEMNQTAMSQGIVMEKQCLNSLSCSKSNTSFDLSVDSSLSRHFFGHLLSTCYC